MQNFLKLKKIVVLYCVMSCTLLYAVSATISVDKSEVEPGETVRYTVTINNTYNPENLNSVELSLANGFDYVANSSSGVTSNNPNISAQTLTWSGLDESLGPLTLSFSATASNTEGTYTIEGKISATRYFWIFPWGTSTTVSATAPVTVLIPQVDPQPAMTMFKYCNGSTTPSTAKPGDILSYKTTYANGGDGEAAQIIIDESIPQQCNLVSNSIIANNMTVKYSSDGVSYFDNPTNPVTHLRFLRNNLASGASGEIIFAVQIK